MSALLHHETIKTTLPKAKEAARMAEKVRTSGASSYPQVVKLTCQIITLGKKGTDPARRAAMGYLLVSLQPPARCGSQLTLIAKSSLLRFRL